MAPPKPLVAAVFLSFVLAGAAAAARVDSPTVRIVKADQARAEGALLRLADFGAGWKGGMTKPDPIAPPTCPGFDPKESDLTVTGHADATFTVTRYGVSVDQDVQVLISARAVRIDFERTVGPGLAACLRLQLEQEKGVSVVHFGAIPFPKIGERGVTYRALLEVKGKEGSARWVRDFVIFARGRTEVVLTITAPAGTGDQLVRFDIALAQLALQRGMMGSA